MAERGEPHIPRPIADDLRPALSDERVDALWLRIAHARRAPDEARLHRAPQGSRRHRARLAFVAGGALAMAAAALALRVAPSVQTSGQPSASLPAVAPQSVPVSQAPLTRSDGAALAVIAPTDAPAHVALSDGSTLTVSAGAVLVPLEVSARSVVLHLQRGHVRFAIKPGGPRRWVVEAGAAQIEVVGTRFTVDRASTGAVEVEVEHGTVLVRGAGVPDGVTRLSAGGRIAVASVSAGAGPSPEPSGATADESSAHAAQPRPHAVRGERRAKQRAAAQAASAREPAGMPLGALDATTLLAMADRARLARDYRVALGALDRVVKEHAADPRARLAAFTVGQIRDEHLRDRPGAIAAYEQALRLGLTGSLAEDCSARLFRARAALAQAAPQNRELRALAKTAAQKYLRFYPTGRYSVEAHALVEAHAPSDASAQPAGALQP